jgi:hypothetical protein
LLIGEFGDAAKPSDVDPSLGGELHQNGCDARAPIWWPSAAPGCMTPYTRDGTTTTPFGDLVTS